MLTAALAGLELQKKTIDEHIAAVRSMLGTEPKRRGRLPKEVESSSPERSAPRKRRKMSAAARKE